MCTLAIVLLLTATITVGMELCNKQFVSTVTRSESNVLSTTLNSLLADELRYATEITCDGSGNLSTYTSITQGRDASITTSEGRILVKGEPVLAVSAYVHDCQVQDLSITYDKTQNIFTVGYQLVTPKGESDYNLINSREEFQVMVLQK